MSYIIKNLGYRTDFIFNKLDGTLEDRGDYLVATTTSNPNYFWGNFLFFKRPPKKGDFFKWKSLFEMELSDPRIYHMAFGWDSFDANEADYKEFVENGFEFHQDIVLSSSDFIRPKQYNEKIEVRVIDLNEYLPRCVEIQVASATKDMSKKTWQEFYTKSMKKYLSLIEKGHGKWFGAFVNDVLVGSLGIFKSGDTARFQLVNTHPDFQRQGVCSTLMYESCLYAMSKMNASELVIVAEENYHAVKIYQTVGFKEVQKQLGLCWWDKTKTNEA
ncbi:MAG: hypothetical protein CME69_07625 [Halobacteriovorax sp.]|nr:hypothetical protein [Halobacteriovorax sp.]